MLLRRLARPLLATAFVADGVDTLVHPEPRARAASELVQQGQRSLPDNFAAKLPTDPGTMVRVNAIAQVSAGVLLALGKMPRLASLTLAATVIPATVTEQDFWAEKDPERKAAKRNAFLKDMSLLGGLMIASADTQGRPSLGWRGRRAASNAAAAVSSALPFTASDTPTAEALRKRAQDAAARAREIAATKGPEVAEIAQERSAEIAEFAKEHGPEWAEIAKQRSAKIAEKAQRRGAELAEKAQTRGARLAEKAEHRGTELAEIARARGPELASTARERGAEFAVQAQTRGSRLAEKAERRAEKAQRRAERLAEKAQSRGEVLAEKAQRRGVELTGIAKERGPELASTARERSARLAELARERVEARRI